jgi:hypothetical protein
MTTGRAWADRDGKSLSVDPGQELEVDNEEARRLLESGQAVPVAVLPADRVEKRGPGRPRKHPVEVR